MCLIALSSLEVARRFFLESDSLSLTSSRETDLLRKRYFDLVGNLAISTCNSEDFFYPQKAQL